MTRSEPWTYAEYQHLLVRDPQPRDPGSGRMLDGELVSFKSPHRPRPPKPVQPRDNGSSRHIGMACFNASAEPQPRDPGVGGRQLVFRGPQPRDDGSNGCFSSTKGNPLPPTKPQPRDSGARRRREPKEVVPRDPGF